MEENYSDDRISSGMRIKFNRNGNIMESQKIYSNGNKQIKVQIDTSKMEFYFVDAVNGYIHLTGGQGINNLEVLQRHVKKELRRMLNVHFEKEVRNVQSSND